MMATVITYPGQQPEPMDAKPTFEPEVFDGDVVFNEHWLEEQMYPPGRVEREPALDKIQGQIAEIRERHAKLKGEDEYEAVRWHFRVTMFPDRPPTGKGDDQLDDANYMTLLAYIANGKWLGALRNTNKERRQKKIDVYSTRIINHMSLIETIVAYRTQLSEERQWQLLTELRRDMNPKQPDYKASYAVLLCKAYLIAYHYHDDEFLTKSVQRHVRAVMRPTSDNSSPPSPTPVSPMNVTIPTPLDRLREFDDLADPSECSLSSSFSSLALQ